MNNSPINLDQTKKIHFIGIGGIGMSALARFFLHDKKVVSGSDRERSIITDALEKEGVTFFAEQSASNISADSDLIIYTEAMPADHPEMLAAKALGAPMMNYFAALGLVANEYYLIAVSGTHGKTTTTAMLTDVLEEAGLDPTAIIGSLRSKTGRNFRAGKSKYAVVEACEYKRDFLYLKPDVLVITNIELDHVDYYKDLSDVQSAFKDFADTVPEEGFIITDSSSENLKPVLAAVKAQVVDYRQFIDLDLTLRAPGIHNQMNAAAVQGVASTLSLSQEEVKKTLENFAGTWRRFEYKGDFVNDNGKVSVYDDYAHHPTAIKVTIAGMREKYPGRPLTVVFQSHTYTRTAEFFDEFAKALAKADRVFLLPIYAAREENVSGVSSEKLAEKIEEQGTKATGFITNGAATLEIKKTAVAGEVVLVMGAGNVTEVATLLIV